MPTAAVTRARLRAMAIKDGMLSEYDHEMGTTRRLLERLPDDRLTWKPHEKSMSLGVLATHLSHIPEWAGTIMNESSYDLAGGRPSVEPKSSRADILAHFDQTTREARAAMDKLDGCWTAMWTLKREGHEIFTLPRIAAFRSFVLSHLIHHRGQLSVYLRLNDVPVPAIYGPSADEE
jgi:uncharacterized damage-inducible protein DinB